MLKVGQNLHFWGWNMPVSYGGSLNEHLSVRNSVGLFDVSHIGEIKIFGTQAETFLNYALTNDISKCDWASSVFDSLFRRWRDNR